MDFIPNSDDEEDHQLIPAVHSNRHTRQHIEVISSDEEGSFAAGPPQHCAKPIPLFASAVPQQQPKTAFNIGNRPLGTKPAKGNGPRRMLVSSSVASQRAAAASQPKISSIPSQTTETRVENDETVSFLSSQSSIPRISAGSRGPNFIGRQPLTAFKPLPELPPRRSGSAPDESIRPVQDIRAEKRETTAVKPSQDLPNRPSLPTSRAPLTMATHKTSDGVQVVISKRKRGDEDDNIAAPVTSKAKTSSVNTGWGNNFVRIDLKKGHGSTKFKASRHSSSLRRRPGRGRWKSSRLRQVGDGAEFMEGWESRNNQVCFRCNGKGHWAKDCPEIQAGLVADDDLDDEAVLGSTGENSALPPLPDITKTAAPPPVAVEMNIENLDELCSTGNLESHLQRVFGFSSFRGLQVETIRKVLRGEPCLSIMPTGMGKSLCYQLPALLLPGLTVVVSPLIALMHDQCKSAPKELSPAMLWSGQTIAEARQILRDVENGSVKLLFVSPERLSNPYLLAALRSQMPLPLIVIDEAHCVAEWGHSFRPAYFRLGEVLQRDITFRSILALTATATKSTEAAVCGVLRIPQSQVMRDSAIRENLRLNILRSNGTPCSSGGSGNWHQVINLFRGTGPLVSSKSSIIYCAWKADADSLSTALVTAGINAKAYHAGCNYRDRAAVEAAFAARRLRVVVATVAFGMGIDISSVDAVVHATMPRSLEEYVQQIGRAGRDGSEGQCYAFLADQDFISLRSLAYSGMVTKEAVQSVLSRVFDAREQNQVAIDSGSDSECEEEPEMKRIFGVLNCKKLAGEVDMQEESIESILGYLEADEEPYLRVLPKVALTAKVSFYTASAEEMAQQHSIVSSVLAVNSRPRNGLYSVSTAKLAVAAQKPPGAVLQELQNLAQQRLIGFELSSEMGPGYEILHRGEEFTLKELTDSIHARVSTMLRCQVARLDTSYRSLAAAVAATTQQRQESILRDALEEYFAQQEAAGLGGGIVDPCTALNLEGLPLRSAPDTLLQAAKAALRRNQEQGGPEMNAMTLARVLHGTGGASMPRNIWSKRMGAFWGTMKNVDFTAVVRTCILACKSSSYK